MIKVLDSHGNIDTNLLQKEIIQSLTEDIKVKQIDNAKKRAVKTSATFDEFKARVSCAHLKPLNRNEVLSLRDVKKGWTSKKSSVSMMSNLSLLSSPVKSDNYSDDKEGNVHHINNNKIDFPKTVEALERNLQHCKSIDDVQVYLLHLSLTRFMLLMQSHSNVDVFDIVLNALSTTSTSIINDEDRIGWMIAMCDLGSFDLLRRFMSSGLKSQLSTYIVSIKVKLLSITQEQIDLIILKYGLDM